jgi:hypothetical protein
MPGGIRSRGCRTAALRSTTQPRHTHHSSTPHPTLRTPLHLNYTLRVGLLIYLYLCWLSGWNSYISPLSSAHKHAAAPPPYHHSVHLIALGIISVYWVDPKVVSTNHKTLCSRTFTLSACSNRVQITGHNNHQSPNWPYFINRKHILFKPISSVSLHPFSIACIYCRRKVYKMNIYLNFLRSCLHPKFRVLRSGNIMQAIDFVWGYGICFDGDMFWPDVRYEVIGFDAIRNNLIRFVCMYTDICICISIIYLSRILCLSSCLSSCHPVMFLSYSCHSCGTLSYSLCLSNQTDQGNETEGLEREG